MGPIEDIGASNMGSPPVSGGVEATTVGPASGGGTSIGVGSVVGVGATAVGVGDASGLSKNAPLIPVGPQAMISRTTLVSANQRAEYNFDPIKPWSA